MTYLQQRSLAIAVAVTLGMLGAVALGNAETLGVTPRVLAWLSVISTGLGITAGFLPDVRGTAQQPEHIARRLDDLSPSDRQAVLADQIMALADTDLATLRVEIERRRQAPAPESPADHINALLDQSDPLPPNPRYPSGRRG